ncbi:hypothetical protein V1520DRAFT_346128 [Lipomyces starkeyi]
MDHPVLVATTSILCFHVSLHELSLLNWILLLASISLLPCEFFRIITGQRNRVFSLLNLIPIAINSCYYYPQRQY